ncbi:MAG TPA: hypothetical protein VNM14_05900 [Planctomycetota bacterium]|nr:hypothetical protein [Planctomycetota bacterium]
MNGLLEKFSLGRVEQGALCRESGHCDGSGAACRAEDSTLALDLTRKRAEEFVAGGNAPAALGQPEAMREVGSPHLSRDSFSWKKERVQSLTIEVEPYTGDVLDFDLRRSVPETPVSVTKEAATVIGVDALRKRYPDHFSDDTIVSTETIMTNLPLSSDGRGPESPVWYVAVRVKCRCREPIHEKILDQLVHPVTGQPIDWATGTSPR